MMEPNWFLCLQRELVAAGFSARFVPSPLGVEIESNGVLIGFYSHTQRTLGRFSITRWDEVVHAARCLARRLEKVA